MIVRLALSCAWRLALMVALVANPLVPVASANRAGVEATDTTTTGMPCQDAMMKADQGMGMDMPATTVSHRGKAAHSGCPDHCCPGSKCDMGNCMTHCVVFAHPLLPGPIWTLRAARQPHSLAGAIPSLPPGQPLRPPIA